MAPTENRLSFVVPGASTAFFGKLPDLRRRHLYVGKNEFNAAGNTSDSHKDHFKNVLIKHAPSV